MRLDQHMGLPEEAIRFLAAHRSTSVCPTCNHKAPTEPIVIGNYTGMFGHKYPLYRYDLDYGYADEFLQADPWSNGPVLFLGLQIHSNNNIEGIIEWAEIP